MAVDAPLAYLHTAGPAGDPLTRLAWGLGGIAIAVVVIVSALLLWALLRRRPALPPQRIERRGAGLRLVYAGVGVSTAVLLACTVWTLETLAAVARPAREPALTIEVTGHQWWWEARYAGAPASAGFTTANELHIPVGEPVRVVLHGDDVIHSFWVPQLAGKTDTIPGRRAETWLQADRAGRFRGACAEYCGAQHAHMGFEVVAEPPADFARWSASQAAPVDASAAASPGRDVFDTRCAACHTVRGTDAGGVVGPDLTHLMSRRTIAAASLDNGPGTLRAWVDDAPALKPGTQMPAMHLAATDIAAVVDYLSRLH